MTHYRSKEVGSYVNCGSFFSNSESMCTIQFSKNVAKLEFYTCSFIFFTFIAVMLRTNSCWK